jgi:peptidoglycan/LPS O-acetylase OafA/YrhL
MPKSGDSPNLDLLRSFAVLAVLVDHTAGTLGIAQRYPSFFALGRWGVLLFFVHTSFVLMMSLGRLRLSGVKLFTTFYLRRFFRIYPLSVTAVAVAVVAHVPFNSWSTAYEQPARSTILANLLLCQNLVARPSVLGPLWSLPYEVEMYLLLPVLFLFVRKATLRPWVGISIVSVALGLLQPWAARTSLGARFFVDRMGIAEFVPCFLVGVLAYQLSLSQKRMRLQFSTWAITLAFVTAIHVLWERSVGYAAYPEWICCVVVALVVVNCAESAHKRLNQVTHWIAKYSYGIYLGQVAVLWVSFVKLAALPPVVQWSIYLLLIVGVPVACYHLIEEPCISFGKSLAASQPRLLDADLVAGP